MENITFQRISHWIAATAVRELDARGIDPSHVFLSKGHMRRIAVLVNNFATALVRDACLSAAVNTTQPDTCSENNRTLREHDILLAVMQQPNHETILKYYRSQSDYVPTTFRAPPVQNSHKRNENNNAFTSSLTGERITVERCVGVHFQERSESILRDRAQGYLQDMNALNLDWTSYTFPPAFLLPPNPICPTIYPKSEVKFSKVNTLTITLAPLHDGNTMSSPALKINNVGAKHSGPVRRRKSCKKVDSDERSSESSCEETDSDDSEWSHSNAIRSRKRAKQT